MTHPIPSAQFLVWLQATFSTSLMSYTVGVLKYIRDYESSIVNSSPSKSYYLLELQVYYRKINAKGGYLEKKKSFSKWLGLVVH